MKYIITLELECDAEEIIGVKEQIANILKADNITVTDINGRSNNESKHTNAEQGKAKA